MMTASSDSARSLPYGTQLLETILKDGASANAVRDAQQYYHSRVEGKRVQLGNLDRPAPVPKAGSTASKQIERRNQRLIKKFRKLPPRNALKKEEARPLSRRERKEIGLDGVGDISYEDLMPIHQLWTSYIQRLLGFYDENGFVKKSQISELSSNPNAITSFQTSLVKADFCGASIRITRSLNPSLVGIEGLIAKETESTFVVVTKSKHPRSQSNSKLTKVIPKENSVFILTIPTPQSKSVIQVPIYGDQLCNSMQTRATKKFKARRTIDL